MCNLPKFRRNEKQNWELKADLLVLILKISVSSTTFPK